MRPQGEFVVNGRFLGQSKTGVQRYAFNVLSAMNAQLGQTGRTASILAPAGIPDPQFDSLPMQHAGSLNGHAWEQVTLASARSRPLLNLCNTGPVMATEQVVCIHDANVHLFPESYDWKFRMVYKTIQPLLARRAMRVATVSMFSAEQISKVLPVALKDIETLPNGHEHALGWDPSKAVTAPRLFKGEGALEENGYVLALMSRAKHKNLNLVLELAPDLVRRGLKVVLVGGRDSIFVAEDQPVAANVIFAGTLPDDDLAYLLDRALCLVFPSWTEGFGLPLVEAMARKCPVVSSDRASMPEICGDAALLAAPDDPQAWLAQIDRLLASPELRAELVGRGLERLKHFSWNKTAAGYLDLMSGFENRGNT